MRRAEIATPSRPDEILRAAIRVIAADGLEAVTHRRVAAEAGVPLGSTTYYFASREELVRAAFRHYAAATTATLAALGRELPSRTADDLVGFLVEVARREFLAPDMVRVEYELVLRAARDPLLAHDFAEYERGLAARLAEMLERLGAPQPFDAARTALALFRGFELERLVQPTAALDDLRRRLAPVVAALTGAARPAPRADGRTARRSAVARSRSTAASRGGST
jgi:DNA-binding transcriptional regulator YbjK